MTVLYALAFLISCVMFLAILACRGILWDDHSDTSIFNLLATTEHKLASDDHDAGLAGFRLGQCFGGVPVNPPRARATPPYTLGAMSEHLSTTTSSCAPTIMSTVCIAEAGYYAEHSTSEDCMTSWPAQVTATSAPLTSNGTRLRVMGCMMWLLNQPRLRQVRVVATAVGGVEILAGLIGTMIYFSVRNKCLQ